MGCKNVGGEIKLEHTSGKLILDSTLWKVICAQDCSVALERLLILWFPHTKVCCIVMLKIQQNIDITHSM